MKKDDLIRSKEIEARVKLEVESASKAQIDELKKKITELQNSQNNKQPQGNNNQDMWLKIFEDHMKYLNDLISKFNKGKVEFFPMKNILEISINKEDYIGEQYGETPEPENKNNKNDKKDKNPNKRIR